MFEKRLRSDRGLAICSLIAFVLCRVGTVAAADLQNQAPEHRILHVSPAPIATIPDDQQFRLINDAARVAGPGDTVLIHNGVYREGVFINRSGTAQGPIEFRAADPVPRVIVTGADVLVKWTREAGPADQNVFSTSWGYVFLPWVPMRAHPADEFHKLIGRVEQVFIQGYPMHAVLDRKQMSRGTFFVSEGEKRLYVWASGNQDLSGHGVTTEASARSVIWSCEGSYVSVRGIRFLYAANAAQQGAAQFKGKGDVIEDCSFEQTNGCGAAFLGEDIIVRRCTFADNGQLGFSAGRAHRLLFTDCVVRNNNIKGWSRGWEAGGDKLVLCRDVVIEKSVFEQNKGAAIWFDIGNENCTVRNCLITGNQDAGIFYEISFGLHAHDNVIRDNGFTDASGAWGAQAGICLSNSSGCVIERNLIVGNREGFNFREQSRSTPTIDGPANVAMWNHDEVIRNNVLAYNRDAQTWGWFDVPDDRELPVAMRAKNAATSRLAKVKSGAADSAELPATQPAQLSLETLNIQFANNLYCTDGTQKLFAWGVPWRFSHFVLETLEDVRSTLNLETGSVSGQIAFADPLTGDLRVAPDSTAMKLGCYPQGEVPLIRLGTIDSQAPR